MPMWLFCFMVLMFVVCTVHFARADKALPFDITCADVVRYAADMKIPNTWRGRVQAKIIALTYGTVLTRAQLDAAAQCLREADAAK